MKPHVVGGMNIEIYRCVESGSDIDKILGIDCYISSHDLDIKPKEELGSSNFYVYEYLSSYQIASIPTYPRSEPNPEPYYLYVLRKKDIDTINATHTLARIFGFRSEKPIAYLGLKDSRAETYQYIVIEKPRRFLPYVKYRNIEAVYIGLVKDHRRLIDRHIGNCFNIKLYRLIDFSIYHQLYSYIASLNIVPNYYSYQRFGVSRPITHMVGFNIVTGNYDDALKILISGSPFGYRLEWGDIKSICIGIVSSSRKWMWIEKKACREIIGSGGIDARRIFKTIVPHRLLKLYIDAFKSYLFNMYLSLRWRHYGLDRSTVIHRNIETMKKLRLANIQVPHVASKASELLKVLLEHGYDSLYVREYFLDHIRRAYNENTHIWRRFLRSEIVRPLLAIPHNLKIYGGELFFCLERGGYATNLLREIFKENTPCLFSKSFCRSI